MVFEIKFVEKNILLGCAIHLLHGMHSQVNLQWLWTMSFFVVDLHVRCQQQTNQLYLLPNCVLHFSRAACRFHNMFMDEKKFLDVEMYGEFNNYEFTQMDDEFFLGTAAFSPDGTAE